MRVAMYYNNANVRLEEIPVPEIGPGELLVKVMASGVCGSDVMEWYRIKKAPLVLGHEITGEIVSLGEGVTQYKKWDRVFVSHHVPCNTCRYCLNGQHTVCNTLHSTNFDPGGYAEYLRVPAINVDRGVFLLPEEMSYEDGSFIEPLACVIRGQRLAHFKPGSSVLVMGSGISGLLHIALASALGAGRVIATDINDFRLESALRFGADVAINAKKDLSKNLLQANENRPVDLVIICTGALSAFTQALQLVDRGGTVLFFAPTKPGVDIPLPVNDFWRKGITLIPSYGASPLDISEAITLIRARKVPVHDMITHRLSLAETGSGFKLVADAADSIKVIIEPQR
ncbi:MAG: zinc-dependent dehydrogenase [Thermodesulfobacteriota bacterium]